MSVETEPIPEIVRRAEAHIRHIQRLDTIKRALGQWGRSNYVAVFYYGGAPIAPLPQEPGAEYKPPTNEIE